MTDDSDTASSTTTGDVAAPASLSTGMSRLARSQRGLNQELRLSTALGKGFATSLGQAFDNLVIKGRGLGDTMRQLVLSLSQMTLKAAFKPLQDGIGKAFGSLLGNFTNPIAASSGAAQPFAKGGVIASPVAFPLGSGTGVAGERGAEAIMPLARGPDGRLGVAMNGGSRAPSIVFNVTATDADSFRRSESQVAALLARALSQGQRNL